MSFRILHKCDYKGSSFELDKRIKVKINSSFNTNKHNTIIYDRMKTKDRRRDKAEIHVKITDYIKPLVEKYKGKERVFNFSERFATMESFNRAINIGLKEVGKDLGINRLQFYAARHSMATIAVNDVKISKYVVNDMLNHTDQSLKITELYIKKDFSHINEANVKLLDYVLKE